jgi:hypothetical protein
VSPKLPISSNINYPIKVQINIISKQFLSLSRQTDTLVRVSGTPAEKDPENIYK